MLRNTVFIAVASHLATAYWCGDEKSMDCGLEPCPRGWKKIGHEKRFSCWFQPGCIFNLWDHPRCTDYVYRCRHEYYCYHDLTKPGNGRRLQSEPQLEGPNQESGDFDREIELEREMSSRWFGKERGTDQPLEENTPEAFNEEPQLLAPASSGQKPRPSKRQCANLAG